jgi:hypothetical protein
MIKKQQQQQQINGDKNEIKYTFVGKTINYQSTGRTNQIKQQEQSILQNNLLFCVLIQLI